MLLRSMTMIYVTRCAEWQSLHQVHSVSLIRDRLTKAIQLLDNKATVSVYRSAGKVSVESSESPEQIRIIVEALGFPSQIST
mgnify:FL=1